MIVIDMKKGDIVRRVEFEAITDSITKVSTVKKFDYTRRCVQILKGKVNPITKMQEYEDISLIGVDIVALDNPNLKHDRYIITYDNLAKVEIP